MYKSLRQLMQGIRGWIGLFNIGFTVYCLFRQVFVFYIIGYLLGDRDFKCCLLNVQVVNVVVLLLCFSVKALKTLRNQYCNGIKTPRVQDLYSFLFHVICYIVPL